MEVTNMTAEWKKEQFAIQIRVDHYGRMRNSEMWVVRITYASGIVAWTQYGYPNNTLYKVDQKLADKLEEYYQQNIAEKKEE